MFNSIKMIMGSGSVLGYFFQALPIACLAGFIYIAVRLLRLKKTKCQIKWLSEFLRVIFVCYLTELFSLVVLPANFWLYFYDGIFLGWWDELLPVFAFGGFNFLPSLIKVLLGELTIGSWVKTMLVGNILMFVPLGLLLPLVAKVNDLRGALSVAVLVPLCVEVLQLIFGRSFDVDDIICNFIGIIAGAWITLLIQKAKTTEQAH